MSLIVGVGQCDRISRRKKTGECDPGTVNLKVGEGNEFGQTQIACLFGRHCSKPSGIKSVLTSSLFSPH